MQFPKVLKTLAALILLLASPTAIATPAPTSSSNSPMTMTKSSPAQVLERFFKTDKVSSDWFTAEFLAAVPIDQIQLIINQLKQASFSPRDPMFFWDSYWVGISKSVI
jgi:hypothetical protein